MRINQVWVGGYLDDSHAWQIVRWRSWWCSQFDPNDSVLHSVGERLGDRHIVADLLLPPASAAGGQLEAEPVLGALRDPRLDLVHHVHQVLGAGAAQLSQQGGGSFGYLSNGFLSVF